MNSHYTAALRLLLLFSVVFLLTACAAGDAQFAEESPAGFWYGLWHGVISIVALIIHIFNDSVLVYESRNIGGWYDFGFLIGVITVWAGGGHVSCKSAAQKKRDKEWGEISDKVEKKIMRNLSEWCADEGVTGKDEEWDEIGDKVEKKVKRKLKDWAENEELAGKDEEWEEIGDKVEKKLKRKIREWAEKD